MEPSKIITIYIGDNGVAVGQTIRERRWSTYIEPLLLQLQQLSKQLLEQLEPHQERLQLQLVRLQEQLQELAERHRLQLQPVQLPLQLLQELLQEENLAVYVTNNMDIRITMNMIKQNVGSIKYIAFFNVIGDLDSPKYYEVLSSIKDAYKSSKILNICIMPAKTRVIDPRVDNQILYNVSAIGDFTDSTILIEHDKIVEIVEKERKKVIMEDIQNKIADILSYYTYVMFINKSTRQNHDDILNRIPLEKGIATLAYVEDTANPDEMADKLITDYLVGYKKSTTIYRQVICDDPNVTRIIDNILNTTVKTAGVLTYIAPSLVSGLPLTDLPPRGLTIVIDTGIKEFFSGLKDKLLVKNDAIIKEIYSKVEYTKDMLPTETNLELLISRYIAYSYIGQIYQDNTQDITNLDMILDEWLGSGDRNAKNLIDNLNNVLTEINNKFKSSSTSPNVVQYNNNIFDNLDDFFSTIVLPPFLVVNGVKSAVTALNKVLSKTTNKFILTNNIIYQIIKQNNFSILKNPKAVKDILEISIESGKSLPIDSPYLKIVGSLREVEGINKIDLEILRLDRLDDI